MIHPYLQGEANSHVDNAATLAAGVVSQAAAAVDESGQFPGQSIAALADAGLFGLCVPQELGGSGQSMRTFAAVVEELATACPSTAMIYVMHVTAAQAIASSASLAGRDELLRDIAAGRHLSTLALSEAGSRSQFWAPVSRLESDGNGGYTTSASKSWVTSAGHADSYVSSALRPGAESPLESTIYLVRRGADGVRTAGAFHGLGLRGNDSSPVAIEQLHVSAGELVSAQGEGANTMLQVVLPWFAVGTAAMANGICRAAADRTAQHLQSTGFAHTGTSLRDLPTLRARLADMSVRVSQSRALLGYTLGVIESGSEAAPLFVLQSRLSSIEAAVDVTDLAMKACGGAAFSKQVGVERFFRDARAGWVMAPTADHLRDFIGRALTGLPLF
ncbi:MAG TPA: acyl-CoA dehydrogenase family protein [Thermoanaerobaculia bacterium]|nr:acyl-CoA dehydrogenase family protein [Thermoanaerobaculia bacterium]